MSCLPGRADRILFAPLAPAITAYVLRHLNIHKPAFLRCKNFDMAAENASAPNAPAGGRPDWHCRLRVPLYRTLRPLG